MHVVPLHFEIIRLPVSNLIDADTCRHITASTMFANYGDVSVSLLSLATTWQQCKYYRD